MGLITKNEEINKLTVYPTDEILEISQELLTKESLLEILRMFDSPLPKNSKKSVLFEGVKKAYAEKPEKSLVIFSEETFKLLQKVIKNGGTLESKKQIFAVTPTIELDFFGIYTSKVIDDKTHLFTFSETFLDMIERALKMKNAKKIISEKTRIDELFLGMVNYYGVIAVDQFSLLFKNMIEAIPESEIPEYNEKYSNMVAWTMIVSEFYYRSLYLQSWVNLVEQNGNYYLVPHDAPDNLSLTTDIENRTYIDYKILEESEYREYAQNHFVKETAEVMALEEFFKNHKITGTKLKELIDGITYNIQLSGHLGFVINFITEMYEFTYAETQTLADLINNYWNNMPHFIIKGHTPNEVAQMRLATDPISSEKIQRNAECPCGSGKKYKKCCGKNK